MPRHSASVQSTTTTTHSFVGLAQPTRPPTGVVIPPRARPVGRPDVGYSESCVMASEDSGAVDGGVGTFSSDAVASLSASVEGLQLSRRRPISRSRRCIPAFVFLERPPGRRVGGWRRRARVLRSMSLEPPFLLPRLPGSPRRRRPRRAPSLPRLLHHRREGKTQQSHRRAVRHLSAVAGDPMPPRPPSAPRSPPHRPPLPRKRRHVRRGRRRRARRGLRPAASTRGPKTLPLDSPRSTPS